MLLFALVVVYVEISISVNIRPPSVPLIVQDPYISLWSPFDNLYDGSITHWSGGEIQLTGFIILDNSCFRFMGTDQFKQCPVTLKQTSLNVNALSTHYSFNDPNNKIELNVSFITPSIINASTNSLYNDTEWLSFPISFLQFSIKSIDSNAHNVSIYFDIFGELPAATLSEYLQWEVNKLHDTKTNSDFIFTKMGTSTQKFNNDAGSDRIDWGYMQLGINITDTLNTYTINNSSLSRQTFIQSKGTQLPTTDLKTQPRIINDNWPSITLARLNQQLLPNNIDTFEWIFGYDENVGNIQYFGTIFDANWKRLLNSNGNLNKLLLTLYGQRDIILSEVNQQNQMFYDNIYSKYSNDKYATICSMIYRQVSGGTIVVYNNKINEAWIFFKEISSDGDVQTVDVLYPFSPFWLYFNSNLMKPILAPLLAYSNNDTNIYDDPILYNLEWAPHHLGHWPVCDLPPNKQEQMPVEETGNFFLTITAVVQNQYKKTNKYDLQWLAPYWGLFNIWGKFLISNLPCPPKQLCTDDFEGPMANNSNLAMKGIIGLYAYGLLLEYNKNETGSQYYKNIAMNYAKQWPELAIDTDRSHYRFQYQQTGSWSLKYNLVYQDVLNIDRNVLFNQSIYDLETNYYQKQMLQYGIPLNNGTNYTLNYDEFWVSCLGNMQQFGTIVDVIFDFVNVTPQRVPLTDWYFVNNGDRKGFEARPTVGGFYMPMLVGPTN
eukprot:180198_1